MKKLIVGGTAAAAVVAGSIGVALLSPLGTAGAGTAQVEVGQAPGTTAPGGPDRPSGTPGRQGHLDGVLDGLVADGTLTQEQADKVKERLRASGPAGRPGQGGPERRGPGHIKPSFEAAAAAIGISTDELRTALRAGKTMAEVAQERGVDRQALIDALVADATRRIDEAVASGKLTAERAAEAKGRLPEAMARVVDHEPGPGGPGRPHRGRPDGPGAAVPPGDGEVAPPTTQGG